MTVRDEAREVMDAIGALVQERKAGGASFDEIRESLERRDIRPPIRRLRELLGQMVTAKTLVVGSRASDGGRPAKIYLDPAFDPQPSLFDFDEEMIRTREEVAYDLLPPAERRQVDEQWGYLAQITLDHLSRDELVEAVRLAVPQMAAEDPVLLLLDFAEWTVEYLRGLRRKAQEALVRGAREELEKAVQDFRFVAGIARSYFRDLFHLHRGVDDQSRIFDVRDVDRIEDPTVPDDRVVCFDRTRAEPILRGRVVGARVLDLERDLRSSDDPNDEQRARVTTVATDASMIPVQVKTRPRGSYELPETLLIFTGAAAQVQVVAGGLARLVDHDFDPGFLKARDEMQAAEQGWMITEFIQEVIGEGQAKYAISAAQDFRQYRRDADALLNRISWRGAPGLRPEQPDVLVRDGRLFPVVHRLKDYEASGLYGRIVRNELQEFEAVCRRALDEYDYLAYGAFVKQPFRSFLAPLVFWYCRCRVGLKDRVPERVIFRSRIGDSLLAYIMLQEFLKTLPEEAGAFATTFRVLRRYSDLATEEMPRLPLQTGGYRPVNEADEPDWSAYFLYRRKERQRLYDDREEESPPLPERAYLPLKFLCYRVGVLMGFALPADGRFTRSPLPHRLPRVEVLVDLARDADRWRMQYRRLLSAFTDRDTLVPDDDHPDGSAVQLIIPYACREAHRAAVFADDIYRREFERKLVEVIQAVEGALRRRAPEAPWS